MKWLPNTNASTRYAVRYVSLLGAAAMPLFHFVLSTPTREVIRNGEVLEEIERDAQRIHREAEKFAAKVIKEHKAKIPQAHVRHQNQFHLKTSDFNDLQRHSLKAQKKLLEAQLKALDKQLIHLNIELNRVDDQVNEFEFRIEVKGEKGEGNSKHEPIHEREADHDPFRFFRKDVHDEDSIPKSDQDDGDH
ncbi:MAG TPA: hypothetical protein EYQ50_29265 [Verrucomicrobiales bacterium]|nr:hypothetical protein [Verrucomicrobiales bacterium]HIL72504.1 hypothetical protein [Verrucomicrobiota bacterium]